MVGLRGAMTQRELAERVGVSKAFISLVETGQRGISLDHLERLANVFDVPVSFLLVLAEQPKSGRKRRLVESLQSLIRTAILAEKGILSER